MHASHQLDHVILHKAETTRCLFHSIQSHDDTFHLSTHSKQLVDLIFICVEGEVPHIEGATLLKLLCVLICTALSREIVRTSTVMKYVLKYNYI